MITPYSAGHLNILYNQFFCDDLSAFVTAAEQATEYPWSVLLHKNPATEELLKIADDPQQGSRIRLLACRRLSQAGTNVAAATLLGVVVEVGIDGGTDTLAAYKDGTARYINHAEKLIIWDSPDETSAAIIQELMQASEQVVAQIGPWTEARRPAPGEGDIRLNFLTTDGLYFGEGPFTVLQGDAMGGPVIQRAVALLQFLTEAAG